MNKIMLSKLIFIGTFVAVFGLYLVNLAMATPSTQIWNPSTDIQATGKFHLGIDNYYSVKDNMDHPYASPTYVGLTYGFLNYFEAGLDLAYPSQYPAYFNFKAGVPEKDMMPSAAVGIMNVGTKSDVTNYNIFYGAVAKTIGPIGRITVGGYSGNDKLLLDENGEKANTGLILTWDKAITDKIWASVDYASGDSFYGSLSFGASYSFAPNVSVIFGYVIYNNDILNSNDQATTQVDINF
ncbi:MAG: hypothetical protein PHD29_09225 [bacterium]|nr:hypothetical protein [bacterium]